MNRECRHIKVSGGKCKAHALTGKDHCYFHSAQRRRDARPRSERWSVEIPFLEDRSTIQLSISEVADSLAGNRIDPKRAGLLLYALQIASQNLKSGNMIETFCVLETTTSSDGEELAGAYSPAPGQPSKTHNGSIAESYTQSVRQASPSSNKQDHDELDDPDDDGPDTAEDRKLAAILGIPGYKSL